MDARSKPRILRGLVEGLLLTAAFVAVCFAWIPFPELTLICHSLAATWLATGPLIATATALFGRSAAYGHALGLLVGWGLTVGAVVWWLAV